MGKVLIELRVNGEDHEVAVEPRRLLSELLRDDLNLTGTKRGCETGICGACTVLMDGEAVKSCLLLAIQADGRELTTIEGVHGKDGTLHPIQQAFAENGGMQCGYCTPGMVMSTKAFLERNPQPSEEEIRKALSGNLCRCTGYVGIVDSIAKAAEAMRGAKKE